jgi:protein-tyrosine phosphatase
MFSKRISVTRNFTDYHCHLLPAVDDGSADVRESLEMARILAGFGFGVVHCTPHRIKGCYDNDRAKVVEATRSLQQLVDQAGIDLRLVPGTEHYLDEFLIEQVPEALTVASRYLLTEIPFRSGGEMIPAMISWLDERGLAPLFAHPERCKAFEPPPREEAGRGILSFLKKPQQRGDMEGSLILKLLGSGCRFQGNLGSFAGVYGREVKERALLFLKHNVYSCLGSDAHRSDSLPSILSSGYETIAAEVGEEGAKRLLRGLDVDQSGGS